MCAVLEGVRFGIRGVTRNGRIPPDPGPRRSRHPRWEQEPLPGLAGPHDVPGRGVGPFLPGEGSRSWKARLEPAVVYQWGAQDRSFARAGATSRTSAVVVPGGEPCLDAGRGARLGAHETTAGVGLLVEEESSYRRGADAGPIVERSIRSSAVPSRADFLIRNISVR